MGSQRRPFTEEMGPQLGLEGQEKNQLMRKIRQCTRMERRNAEVKVSKVDLAVEGGEILWSKQRLYICEH